MEEQTFYEKKFLPVPPFAEQFWTAMKECKTTQYALKKKTGILWNNFYQWLNGKSKPYPDSLVKIALAMDCSGDFLLGRVN